MRKKIRSAISSKLNLRFIVFFFLSLFAINIAGYQPTIRQALNAPIESCSADYAGCCNVTFDDVSIVADYYGAVHALSRACIVNGNRFQCSYNSGYSCFNPGDKLTRIDAVTIIARYHQFIRNDWSIPQAADINVDDYFEDVNGAADLMRYLHAAKVYGLIQGQPCSDLYAPGSKSPYDSNYTIRFTKSDGSIARCFDPLGDWAYGFHGVNSKGSHISDNSVPPEDCYNGCYDWVSADPPYYTYRVNFAKDLYNFYLANDDTNRCINPHTGSLTASGNPCVIHAGQTSCTSTLSYSTQHTNNTKQLIFNMNGGFTGVTGSYGGYRNTLTSPFLSAPVTDTAPLEYRMFTQDTYFSDPTDTIPHSPAYTDMSTDGNLSTVNLSAVKTKGYITSTSCSISAGQTTCNTTLNWSTSYISIPASVSVRNMTTNTVIASTNSLSGSVSVAIPAGTTNFGVYENNILLNNTEARSSATATQLYNITGTINVDYNDNAAIDPPSDSAFTEGTTITLSTGATTTSLANGTYTLANVPNGTYTVSLPATITSASYPDGLGASSVQTNPITVTVNNANAVGNFFITPFYNVTGGIFVDTNKNGKKTTGESYYSGSPITVTNSNGGTISYPSSGTYKIGRLKYGPQTISYTSAIPSGYVITFPKVGSGAPSYTVQVGKPCAATPVSPTGGDGTCSVAGNIYDVNFGISNSTPWLQGVGFDMRFDGGLTNQVPSLTNACGAMYTMMPNTSAGSDATSQGGVYIGNSSAISAFGVRQTPSSKGWVIDSAYPETYKPVVPGTIRTSYAYLLSATKRAGLTQTAITTSPTCTDPSVSCSLPNLATGVYVHEGDVQLSTLTIPANRNVIMLIKGNLSILGQITVPNTSTLTISVGDTTAGSAGNITIDKSIGAAPTCPAPTGQIQGIFTADKTFTVNGIGDCTVGKDTMITIEGAVVVNASLSSGAFTNYRDLCDGNISYPGVVIKERPDFIFHAPDLIKQQNYLFREVAP